MKRLNPRCTKLALIAFVAIAVIGGTVKADFTFGEATNLGPAVNSPDDDGHPGVSSDGLELYFDSLRPGGLGGSDLWVSTRTETDANWVTPANLGLVVNSASADWAPILSADGLSLYFSSNRPDSLGSHDIWVTDRPTKHDDWGTPVNLGPTVNSESFDWAPFISTDGLALYFSSNRAGGSGMHDIWVSTRQATDGDWGTPLNPGTIINSENWDGVVYLLPEGRTLLFGSANRPGGAGTWDIWITSRPTIWDDWSEPAPLPEPVNTAFAEGGVSLSGDGAALYLSSDRPGGLGSHDIWHVPIEPVVDLNGDGVVDCADMCIMVDHWGEDYPFCDIGPTPWGDGIVDVEDLIVLAEHLFEELPPVE